MCEKMPFNVDLNQINNNENEKKNHQFIYCENEIFFELSKLF
jgi:hypothetical protein